MSIWKRFDDINYLLFLTKSIEKVKKRRKNREQKLNTELTAT